MEIVIFIIGLIFGSFYNVVGLRLPKNESIIFPGSHCFKCNHKLSWYENIPVISFIFLKIVSFSGQFFLKYSKHERTKTF